MLGAGACYYLYGLYSSKSKSGKGEGIDDPVDPVNPVDPDAPEIQEDEEKITCADFAIVGGLCSGVLAVVGSVAGFCSSPVDINNFHMKVDEDGEDMSCW